MRAPAALAACVALLGAPAQAQEFPQEWQPVTLPLENPQLELGGGEEFAWLAYRTPDRWGDGELTFELFATDDDDILVSGELTRLSPPQPGPFHYELGLGIYSAFVNRPGDDLSYGLSIVGGARLQPPGWPIRLEGGATWSPDLITFDGGDQYLDAEARVEVELGGSATAFAGYRVIEVDYDDGFEKDVADGYVVGFRFRL